MEHIKSFLEVGSPLSGTTSLQEEAAERTIKGVDNDHALHCENIALESKLASVG
jgi:hypothetical protein